MDDPMMYQYEAHELGKAEEYIKELEQQLEFHKHLVSRYQKYFAANVMIPNEEYSEMCKKLLAR